MVVNQKKLRIINTIFALQIIIGQNGPLFKMSNASCIKVKSKWGFNFIKKYEYLVISIS